MGRAGAQVVVDDDAAGLSHGDAGGAGQFHVGAHAQADDHQVGQDSPCRGLDGGDSPIAHREATDSGAQSQVGARGAHRFSDRGSHVAATAGHLRRRSLATAAQSRMHRWR